MTDRIFLSAPQLGDPELRLVAEAVAANEIALGRATADFEARLAVQAGTRGAVAVSSGTAALHLALDVLGVGPGDRVFCPSLTFVASAAPIRYLGAEPVFIDAEPESWNMSPPALERALEEARRAGQLPKAAIVASLYGQSADFDRLGALCRRHGVAVVEDAAESLGADCRGRPSGGLGDVGAYSFNGNKIVTTGGGGALLCDDPALVARARKLAAQAREPGLHYEHARLGYNYRLSNIAAAIGVAQMDRLEARVAQRRAVFARYREALGDLNGIGFMPDAGYGRHTHWLSVITVTPHSGRPDVPALCAALDAAGIEARPVWKPLHRQPVFAGTAYFPHAEDTSVSDAVFAAGLCLPSGPDVIGERQERVIGVLREAMSAAPKRAAV